MGAWFAAGVLGEGGIIVEGDGLAQRRVDEEHRQHNRMVSAAVSAAEPPASRAIALMENEHWRVRLQ